MPNVSATEFSVATPFCRLASANGEDPSWKMTVPVGVPDGEVTVAISAIKSPTADGLAEEASAVLVAASGVPCTLTIKVAEVLAAKSAP